MQHRTPLQDFPLEAWHRITAVNLDSVFFVGQAVARHMIPRGHGKIINICSVQSELGRPGIAPYSATKGAVKMLTEGMAIDWGRHGLQVNGLGPGYFRTELNQALVDDPTFSGWLATRTPTGRWGEVEELGGAAIFLASDASSFINGHISLCRWGHHLQPLTDEGFLVLFCQKEQALLLEKEAKTSDQQGGNDGRGGRAAV